MSSFFSKTDLFTLQSEGADRNNFVSLIVNNEGSYSAAITRKVARHLDIEEDNACSFFGNDSDKNCQNYSVDEEVVEFYMLDIDRQIPENSFSYLDERFEKIKSSKKTDIDKNNRFKQPASYAANSPWLPKSTYKEPSLFKEEELDALDDMNLIPINPVLARSVTVKMLLCSFLANTSKTDMEKFVKGNMQQVYDHFFESAENLKFTNYADWVTDYLVSCSCPPDEDETLWATSMALAIQQILLPYEKDNPYIHGYIDALDSIILQEI